MKRIVLGMAAAIGLTLAATSTASAHWVTRMTMRWDPYCGHYVAVPQRVWVPEPICSPVVPGPITIQPYPYPWYRTPVRPAPSVGFGATWGNRYSNFGITVTR